MNTGKRIASLLLAVIAVIGAYFAGRNAMPRSAQDGGDVGRASPTASNADSPAAKQLWTCSMHPQVIQDHPGQCPICHMELTPVRAGEHDGGGVTIDPSVLQNMGVRTAVVAKGPLVQSVRVVGYLEEPEPLHRDINLRVSGWIEKLYANSDGMVITEGLPLFDLYSPELTVAVDELISARKQSVNSTPDSPQRSLLDAARRKLLQYGLGEKQVDDLEKLDTAPRTVPICAPISGHLTAKMVYEGAAVKAGDLVLRLASRHHMWIDAQVYEQQLPLISDGQPARATLVSQPGKIFDGKVLFVHPHIDPTTRTALVRIEIPNEGLHLRQGMYATVEILADNYEETITVPREAVIDSGRRQVAFVDVGGGRFEPRDIKLGLPAHDGFVQVLSGLKEGERVVTSGQFLIDGESRMREALSKFGSAPTPLGTQDVSTPIAAAVEKPAAHDHADASISPTTMPTRVPVPHTNEIVREYLAVARILGARQEKSDAIDVEPLARLAAMASEHSQPSAKPLADAVVRTVAAMASQPIDQQRRAFIDLSDAVIALVRVSPPSTDVSPKLYLMNCPMAFDRGEGANWLQDNETVANPYYATSMKRCGSVVEELPTAR